METIVCIKKELSHMMENEMVPEAFDQMTQMGMLSDKYEAAMMYYQVMDGTKDSATKFMDEFFFRI